MVYDLGRFPCQRYFFTRPAVLYHRTNVPKRLRRLLRGRAEIWCSLQTTDRSEAKAKSAEWNSRIQRLFATLKRDGEPMTEYERETLVLHSLERRLGEADDFRAVECPFGDDRHGGINRLRVPA